MVFKIKRFRYIDRHTRNKFDIFARTEQFGDQLASRISKLGVFDLRRAKIRFVQNCVSDIPPYEIEMEQLKSIEEWEKKEKIVKNIFVRASIKQSL